MCWKAAGKWEIPGKTRRPTASSSAIPTYRRPEMEEIHCLEWATRAYSPGALGRAHPRPQDTTPTTFPAATSGPLESRSEGAIRATLTRTPSASSLLRAKACSVSALNYSKPGSLKLQQRVAKEGPTTVSPPPADHRGQLGLNNAPIYASTSRDAASFHVRPAPGEDRRVGVPCLSPLTGPQDYTASGIKFKNPGSIPGEFVPRIFACGNLAGVSFVCIPFRPPFRSVAAPYSPHFSLIASQDLAVKSRPHHFSHSLIRLTLMRAMSLSSPTPTLKFGCRNTSRTLRSSLPVASEMLPTRVSMAEAL
ncbi:hypothetical protein PR048_000408 [Dryococelus australis]|uniref:Uncharacterized protein n=1 Tax=Dryococelus australis TaxID=614101 RepID=A0ABQ9IEH9_9NEOP|nr:hypothetical protein PR048_000408 [Dryococelus australis]